ncbi:MAG TPA: hypothetical protein VFT81_01650, partial [Dermatophilaceae bacterium]|nr:hypothetical protein [Dermatophilaceae bacterium]
MSKDDAVNNGAYGIPGYTSNNAIPGSFELPLPLPAQDAEPEPVPESVDPWATTWDTAAWDTPSSESPYSASSETSYSAGDSWSSSSYEPPTVTADSWTVDSSWDTQTDWSTDTSWTSTESQTDSQTEEYSGWVPQGASPFGEPGGFTHDHRQAELAHASKPPVDPDVAEAALEVGTDPYSTAYERDVDFDRPGTGPHADDLITARSRGERQKTKASSGVRRAFGLAPGKRELLERDRIDRIARPLDSRKTIMVINTKGGGGKTLVTLMLASYLGRYRSGSVLAWDNNETEGTLGMRAPS